MLFYANNLELVNIQSHSGEIRIFIHFPNSKGDFLHEDSDNGKIARGNFWAKKIPKEEFQVIHSPELNSFNCDFFLLFALQFQSASLYSAAPWVKWKRKFKKPKPQAKMKNRLASFWLLVSILNGNKWGFFSIFRHASVPQDSYEYLWNYWMKKK